MKTQSDCIHGRVGCVPRSDRLFVFLKKEDDLAQFSWLHYGRYRSNSKRVMSLSTQRVSEKYQTNFRTVYSLPKCDIENLTCDYWSFCAPCSCGFWLKSITRTALNIGFIFFRHPLASYQSIWLLRSSFQCLSFAWKLRQNENLVLESELRLVESVRFPLFGTYRGINTKPKLTETHCINPE